VFITFKLLLQSFTYSFVHCGWRSNKITMSKCLEVKMLLNIFDLVTTFEIDRPGVEVKRYLVQDNYWTLQRVARSSSFLDCVFWRQTNDRARYIRTREIRSARARFGVHARWGRRQKLGLACPLSFSRRVYFASYFKDTALVLSCMIVDKQPT